MGRCKFTYSNKTRLSGKSIASLPAYLQCEIKKEKTWQEKE